MRKHELCAILNVAEDDTELGVLTKNALLHHFPLLAGTVLSTLICQTSLMLMLNPQQYL